MLCNCRGPSLVLSSNMTSLAQLIAHLSKRGSSTTLMPFTGSLLCAGCRSMEKVARPCCKTLASIYRRPFAPLALPLHSEDLLVELNLCGIRLRSAAVATP